ncbi:putative ABC transporter permease [Clostridium sp.]|uniref:putative ABC transporter permease n=1 Tax=Clostridium sp. TaxID=1506 RepID=UPI0034643105
MRYSFLGWCLENIYCIVICRRFKEDKFLQGPFKPMYGFAPVIIILLLNYVSSWVMILTLSFIVPSLVEYISGFLLKKFFNKQWWDYSKMKLSLKGHICLRFSIYWVFLSIFTIYFIQPRLETLYNSVVSSWEVLSPFIVAYILIDLTYTYIVLREKRHHTIA